jgi:hypothetical protein
MYIPHTVTNIYTFQQKFEELVSSVTSSTILRATHPSIKLINLFVLISFTERYLISLKLIKKLVSFMDRCVAREMVEPVTFGTK